MKYFGILFLFFIILFILGCPLWEIPGRRVRSYAPDEKSSLYAAHKAEK